MEAVIFRGDLTDKFDMPCPFLDKDNRRIGTVTGIRFDGQVTIAEIECVPEDIAPPIRSVNLLDLDEN